ncbi:MAG TPA: hypothetical protein VG294_14515 [Solirubrobacteraceae bacterium]|jgi:hypothetical protein|nr:hypothetical protein [Solirubrobacteraceae bacterium]
MKAPAGRSSVLAGVVATVLAAIGGCGSSGSQHRPRHAVFVPPGLAARPGNSTGSQTTSSTAASSHPVTGSARSSAAPTGAVSTVSSAGAVSVGATGAAGTSAASAPVAKVTFAAPGGESHAGFVASADGICRSFRARARAIGARATTLSTQETELGQLVTATERSVKALTELSPPTADAAGLRVFANMTVASVIAFAEAQSRTSSTSEAVGSRVEARDLADSSRSSRDAAAAQAAARRLRLRVCGSSGSAWL